MPSVQTPPRRARPAWYAPSSRPGRPRPSDPSAQADLARLRPEPAAAGNGGTASDAARPHAEDPLRGHQSRCGEIHATTGSGGSANRRRRRSRKLPGAEQSRARRRPRPAAAGTRRDPSRSPQEGRSHPSRPARSAERRRREGSLQPNHHHPPNHRPNRPPNRRPNLRPPDHARTPHAQAAGRWTGPGEGSPMPG